MRITAEYTTNFLNETKRKIIIEENTDQHDVSEMYELWEGIMLAFGYQKESIDNYYLDQAETLELELKQKEKDEVEENF